MQRQVAALERKKKHIEQSVDKMKQAATGKHGDQKKSDLVASREKKLGRMGLEKTADGKKFNAQKPAQPQMRDPCTLRPALERTRTRLYLAALGTVLVTHAPPRCLVHTLHESAFTPASGAFWWEARPP